MATDLPTGYARATLPISGGTISTDTEGLEAGEVRIRSGEIELPAYYAKPRDTTPPVVLVVQEIFGVHEHIRDICRRLAKVGYYAIAPELYVRQGDPSTFSDMHELTQQVVSKVPDEQVLRDLDAVVEYVKASGKGDTQRLGICGFCWGGRIVWLYAAHQEKLKAGAAWYGKLTPGSYSKPDTQPKQPMDVAGELHGAVIGFYGGKDEGIPLPHVDRMLEKLHASKQPGPFKILVYPEAGHAFNADYRSSYDEAAAKDAWMKMLDWLGACGLGV